MSRVRVARQRVSRDQGRVVRIGIAAEGRAKSARSRLEKAQPVCCADGAPFVPRVCRVSNILGEIGFGANAIAVPGCGANISDIRLGIDGEVPVTCVEDMRRAGLRPIRHARHVHPTSLRDRRKDLQE